MKFHRNIILLFLVLELAVMPAFSVLAAPAAVVPLTGIVNSFVLQLKDGNPAALQADANVQNVEHVFVDSTVPKFKNTFRLETVYTQTELVSKFGADFVYIEPQHIVRSGTTLVNDPGFSADPTNVDRQWGLHKAGFTQAWDKTQGSKSVVIAEIDTGIDGTHEDLSAGQVGPGYNFLNKTFIPFNTNSDDNGHGTLVAGIIGATPNNFRGIAGAVWNAQLMPLKALDGNGSGNSADVAAAIVWAADHGASIINMSLGGIGFSNDTTLSDAISYAFNRGLVIVAAAGNDVAVDGGNLDLNPVFPICDDNGQNMVIGVAATDINDQKAVFSNYGHVCVDVSAPGKRILSTINHDPQTQATSPNTYAYASGTSLAAPFVTAEAALIRAAFPSISNTQVRDRIMKSADQIDILNNTQCNGAACTGQLGSGRINAFNALDPSLNIVQVKEGDLIRIDGNDQIYYISGGQRQPVSAFVYNQRFSGTVPKTVQSSDVGNLPIGPYALPLENTIVKTPSDNTVYDMLGGFKRPLTYQIYLQRDIQQNQIAIVSDAEMNTWITGKFVPPVEGTLVKTGKNPTVYWVIDGLLHPINYGFWIDRGLNIFPIMVMSDADLAGFAQGNAFIR